ncbi:MAG: hypothetical protein WBW71_00950 [Bacteroidota bacterium]
MSLDQLLHDQANDILSDAEASIARARLAHYEKSGTEHTHQRLKALYTLTARAVKEKNLGPMVAHAETIGRERFEAGFDLSEVQTAFNVLEEAIWMRILKNLSPGELAEALGLISTVLGAGKDALARTYVSLASKTKAPSLNLHSLFAGTQG